MRHKQNSKTTGISRIITVFIVLLMIVLPIEKGSAADTVSIRIEQIFNTTSNSTNVTFTYLLKPLDSSNPMPTGSTQEGYIINITGNDNATIEFDSFDKAGIYYYALYQVVERERSFYTYDRRIYTVEIHVDMSLRTYLIIKNENDKKEEYAEFVNGYDPGGTIVPPTPPTTTEPPVSPEPTLPPTSPVPPPTTSPIEPPETAGPSGPSGPPGTPDVDEGINIDDGDIPIEGGNPDVPRSGIDGPKTGDEFNAEFYILLFGFGGFLAAGAVLFLVIGKKRREGED